jgi:outer membrane protein assembly factor BamB
MKKRERFFTTFVCLLAMSYMSLVIEAQPRRPQSSSVREMQAQSILDATGIKGGLVVHIGCADAKLTTELYANERYLVHGLDTDADNVKKARDYIKSLGLYGKVSVEQFAGNRLPYTDNLVNLIVSENPGNVLMNEVMRVLCPNGVAYIKTDGKWTKTVKPRSKDIDEWTHYLHDASNNAVANDTHVGPPRYLQWIGKPKFARAHEQLASLSSAVTGGGRLFYIIDEGPQADVRLPSEWYLAARDAFNGVNLWKKRIGVWADQLRRFRSGPPDLAFRLVTGNERVYVTLEIGAPVSVLDAATGETLWVYKGTDNTRQIICVDNKLLMLIDTAPQTTNQIESEIRRGLKPAPGLRAIVAADASSENILWRKDIESLVHPTLAAQNKRLFYQTQNNLFCVNMDTGDELWHTPIKMELKGHEVGWESPTLVVQDGIVYYADFKRITAFSTEDGRSLWSGSAWPGYNSPPDIFVIDGLVWTKGRQVQRIGIDALTGTPKKEIASVKGYMHHRCYRNKATNRFLLLGNQGVQFIDISSGEIWQNYWVRGTCQYGIIPANGLLYIPPDSCACNLKTKLNGFYALTANREPLSKSLKNVRLEKGPAYGQISNRTSSEFGAWPTYRHDTMRSGMTKARVPNQLKRLWQADIGGRLSSVTSAGGMVFVSSIDTHTVHALDGRDGSKLWGYTADGRVDSPPTVYNRLVLFGSADGWVYALRASDGKLIWRFRAAPEDRRTFVNGQLESVWPVHGSVLVKDDVLIVTAGRSSYIDGGIYVYRLEPETGRKISETVIYSPEAGTGKQPREGGKEMRGVLSDILSTYNEDVYMRHMKVDFAMASETGTGVHLFTPIGFLDDTWWHRAYWVVNDEFLSHWSAWWKVGNIVPSGRILSYNESSVFGYGRDQYPKGNTGQWRGGEKYQLFAFDRDPGRKDKGTKQAAKQVAKKKRRTSTLSTLEYRWNVQVPFFVTAMVVADKTMFIAGPPDIIRTKGTSGEEALVLANPQEALAAWKGKEGGTLWAVSISNGKKLADYKLDSQPVFDGMAAANNRLYLANKNGRIICFAGRAPALREPK